MTQEEKINLLSKVQDELDRAYFELKAKLPELDPVLQIVEIIAYQAKCVLIVAELQKLGVNYEHKPMN